ncbi:hypothetical protein CA85_36250 [Allorhodopirellula solitaria]|uniref:Secreted protein n=2 Tax=Allorhodopirellula solitaria TaxID=2527987 RepID=A0A5C5XPI3_9BACT|nr:hypothetical protein CA85_36250 [Allorhodopirellula solitaria]
MKLLRLPVLTFLAFLCSGCSSNEQATYEPLALPTAEEEAAAKAYNEEMSKPPGA